ncbi:MAG: class IV adenylate cyclase [Acidobacteriota bacterium]
MAVEFEKKYRLTDALYESLTERLTEIGARFEGEDEEENTIYSLEVLTGRPGILRIRSIGSKTILTFKRRIPSESSVKQQIEHETEVADREVIAAIIAELGLTPAVVYEKRRRTWTLPNAEVVLDVLPFGLYMEIEGTIESIADAERLLGADEFSVEPRTYPALTKELGRKSGALVEARFASEKED